MKKSEKARRMLLGALIVCGISLGFVLNIIIENEKSNDIPIPNKFEYIETVNDATIKVKDKETNNIHILEKQKNILGMHYWDDKGVLLGY